jgi:hypothetical protein
VRRHEVRRAEMRSETGCRMTETSRDCFCDAGVSDILYAHSVFFLYRAYILKLPPPACLGTICNLHYLLEGTLCGCDLPLGIWCFSPGFLSQAKLSKHSEARTSKLLSCGKNVEAASSFPQQARPCCRWEASSV